MRMLTNEERKLIKDELELIERKDLIDNFSQLGDVYFSSRIWEAYPLIHKLGEGDSSLYNDLMDEFKIKRDMARKWIKYDEKISYYYNLGRKNNILPLYDLRSKLVNNFGGTKVTFPLEIGKDSKGDLIIAKVEISLKELNEAIDKLDLLNSTEVDDSLNSTEQAVNDILSVHDLEQARINLRNKLINNLGNNISEDVLNDLIEDLLGDEDD